MGDSWRDYWKEKEKGKKTKPAVSGVSETVARQEANERAKIRSEYFRVARLRRGKVPPKQKRFYIDAETNSVVL